MNKSCRICFVACLWLLVTCSPSSEARRSRYNLKWHSFDCLNLWPIVHNLSCRIEDDGNLSSDLRLSESITEVWVKYKLLVARPTQKSETVLFESEFDGCKLLSDGLLQNKLALKVYHNMIRDSNVGKQCPIHAGYLYFNRVSSLENFPALMPEMDFTLLISFYRPNTTFAIDVKLKGSIMENRKRYNFLALINV